MAGFTFENTITVNNVTVFKQLLFLDNMCW